MYLQNTRVSLFCLTHHEHMKTDPSSQSKRNATNSHFKTLLGLNLTHLKCSSSSALLRGLWLWLSLEAWPGEGGMPSGVARQRGHSAALAGALPSRALTGSLVRAMLPSCRVTTCSCHQQPPQDANPRARHIRRYKHMTKSEENTHWRQSNSAKENVIEKAGPILKFTL